MAHRGVHEPRPARRHVDEAIRSGGKPLDPRTRARFERGFGASLRDVRLHVGPAAAASAAALDAEAYTAGNHIVFGEGLYAPGTRRFDRLLAHELAHTVQQERGPAPASRLPVSRPEDAAEHAADRAAHDVLGGRRATLSPRSVPPTLHRQKKKLSPDAKKKMQQLGKGELDDLLDLIVEDQKLHQYKTMTIDGVEHVWEIMTFTSTRTIHSTFAGAMAPRDVVEDSGKKIRHQKFFTLVLVGGNIETETLFHELLHLRISIDKDLPEGQRSNIYRDYWQLLELGTDPALGAVTGINKQRAAVTKAIDALRDLFTKEIDPASTANVTGDAGMANPAILERLVNEKYANQTATQAVGKSITNATIARRYANSIQDGFAALVSSRFETYKNVIGTTKLDKLTKDLENAILAWYDEIDRQQAAAKAATAPAAPAPALPPATKKDEMLLPPNPYRVGGPGTDRSPPVGLEDK
jgi:hypothetical protein